MSSKVIPLNLSVASSVIRRIPMFQYLVQILFPGDMHARDALL